MWFSMDGLCSAMGLAKLMASDQDGDQMVLGLRIQVIRWRKTSAFRLGFCEVWLINGRQCRQNSDDLIGEIVTMLWQ